MNRKGSKHFTEQERADLLNAILLGKNRDEIAKLLGKSKAAITYELKNNRFLKGNKKYHNNCGIQDECEKKSLCKDVTMAYANFALTVLAIQFVTVTQKNHNARGLRNSL